MTTDPTFPIVIGHRGASAKAPENTPASFRQAVADGAEGLEFDVQLAADGVPVIFHDDTLKRITGSNARLADLTSSDLARLDAGAWFRRKAKAADNGRQGVYIPRLDDVLEELHGYGGRLYVELKCSAASAGPLTEAVCAILSRLPDTGNIIVKSFELSVIPMVRALLPAVTTAALFAPRLNSLLNSRSHLIRIAQEHRADELSLHFSLATAKLVGAATNEGMPVTIWTADHPRWVEHGRRLGLKGIITNDPGSLIKTKFELLGIPGKADG